MCPKCNRPCFLIEEDPPTLGLGYDFSQAQEFLEEQDPAIVVAALTDVIGEQDNHLQSWSAFVERILDELGFDLTKLRMNLKENDYSP